MKQKKEELAKRMRNTKDIRNITIIAHVDHGKTSLSDSLLAQDGLINIKDAGQKRKLDDEVIEQKRQMTVYASHVTISYKRNFPVAKTDFIVQCQTCGHVFLQKLLRDYVEGFRQYSKDTPPNWYKNAVKHWIQTDHDVQSLLQDTLHRDVISEISVDLRKSGKTKDQIGREMNL